MYFYLFILLYTEGDDFAPISSQLITFLPGQGSRVYASINITDDNTLEDVEDFRVVLNTSDPNVFLQPSSATVTILDNDGNVTILNLTLLCYNDLPLPLSYIAVTIEFLQPTYSVLEETGFLTVCALLIGQTARNVTINLTTLEASAQGTYACVYECASLCV